MAEELVKATEGQSGRYGLRGLGELELVGDEARQVVILVGEARVAPGHDLIHDLEQVLGEWPRLGTVKVEGGDERGAHHRELQHVLRLAVDVGADVEHGRHAAEPVGHLRGDRGPVHALEHLEHEPGNRHERPGVARAHAGIGPAFLHRLDGEAHGGLALAAQGGGGGFIHRHRLLRIEHVEPPVLHRAMAGERGPNLGLAPDQQEAD